MEPAPIDVSRLKHILSKSKKVMERADVIAPKNVTESRSQDINRSHKQPETPMYDPRDEREPQYYNESMSNQTKDIHANYSAEHIRASNLPDAVKKIMIERPIPAVNKTNTFTLEDVKELTNEPIINENINRQNSMITVSEAELTNLINAKVEQLVNEKITNLFTKIISEQAIKKTLTTLMKEGKIITKKTK